MKKWMFVLITCLSGTQLLAQGTYQEKVNNYVQKYKDLAIAEQQRSGIPACITLGQGILETSAGCSELMTQANNHFGIKCKKEWNGETFAHTDDAPNECFRKYKCDLDSYKDHSDYLKTSQRYASLFVLDQADYKGWARGLKRCGYATNPRYAQQLIKIIEDFNLQSYTLAAANTTPANTIAARTGAETLTVGVVPQHTVTDTSAAVRNTKTTPAAGDNGTVQVNGLRAFYAHKGDVLLEQAIRYNVRYARLLELNDLPDAPLEADMFVYLERKNSKGTHTRHLMQPGETLLQVAQAEGMQLKQLRTLNQLGDNEQPAEGAVLQLQLATAGKPPVKEDAGRTAIYARNARTTAENDYITKPGANVAASAVTTEEAKEMPVAVQQQVVQQQPAIATPVAEKKEAPAPAPVRVVKRADPPPPARSTQDNFNIANEKAVEETVVRNNPRYIERDENALAASAAPVQVATTPAPSQPEYKATVPATQPAQEAEPQDELAKLKAKLDKVVYGNERSSGGNAMKVSYNTPAEAAPAPVKTESQPVAVAASEPAKYYTVQKGDTAFSIAKKNNITMKQMMDWNHLNFEDIKVGQKLRVK